MKRLQHSEKIRYQMRHIHRTLVVFLSVYVMFFSIELQSQQNPITSFHKDVISSISKFAPDNSGLFLNFIDNSDFEIPSHISRQQWNQFPMLRRIEMMYISAERQNRGIGGQKFLAMLSKHLAQTYESVHFEPNLKPLLDIQTSERIGFKKLQQNYKIKLPKDIKSQIFTLARYADAGALGGPQGIMSHYFGLADDIVYDLLGSSNSNKQALERGLSKSKVPPPHQQRLSHVSRDLQNNFEGASFDKKLSEIRQKASSGNANNKMRPSANSSATKRIVSNKPIKQIDLKRNKANVSKKYNQFIKNKYAAKKSTLKFNKISKAARGFGGVIFGNEINDNTGLPNVSNILFIPSTRFGVDSLQTGVLEFVFSNGKRLREPGVFIEDIIAANDIVFNEENNHNDGEAIGLVGIDQGLAYISNLSRWEVIIHPAIANLKLGWATLLCDVYPIAESELYTKLNLVDTVSQAYKGVNKWLSSRGLTYKITDIPLTVSVEDNQLELHRTDLKENEAIEDVYLTMQSFSSFETEGVENTLFYNLVPSLSNDVLEFYRLNQFAKILALFRWAKQKNGSLVSPPEEVAEIEAPASIFITKDLEIAQMSLEEEIELFKKERKKIQKEYDRYWESFSSNAEVSDSTFVNQLVKKISKDVEECNLKNQDEWEDILLENDPKDDIEVKGFYSFFPYNRYGDIIEQIKSAKLQEEIDGKMYKFYRQMHQLIYAETSLKEIIKNRYE